MPSKTKEVPLPREVSSPHFVLRLAAQLALSAFGFDLALRMVRNGRSSASDQSDHRPQGNCGLVRPAAD